MARPEGQASDTLAPGTVLGRYEIKRQLGRGGMGAVYEAVHRDLKKRVAVKVLSPALAASEEAKQRFLREGEAASRIRHPHVVDVTDVGSDGDVSYLVMEFLEGEDLSNRLARGGLLSPQEAADVLLPVCAGVAAAHDEGVIHRDLKPENIFLSLPRHGGMQPKVLDFGVSKVMGDSASMALTGTAATFGTPFYMPPEQLRGARQADQKSDQYALGVVLYECVTGRRPFEAENVYAMLRAIGDGDYPPPRAVMPLLPQPLEAVIVRAMNVDPTQRFPSVRAFGAALLQFASEGARVLWADAFRADEVARASNVEAGFTRPMLATGPGSPGSVSGTQILPSSSASASTARSPLRGTTLGAATGQRLDLEPPRRGRAPLVIAFVVAVAGGGGAVLALRPKTPPTTAPAREASATPAPAATYRLEVDTDPPGATVELDGIPAGVGMLSRDLPKDGREHRLVARAPGYRDAVVRFLDQPPARHIRMAADETAPPPATAATTATTTPPPSKVSPPPKKGHPHPHPSKGPAQPQQPAPRETPPPANGAPVID